MASFYSKPADYGNYTQPINLDLVNFVLSSKQQKYDYNLAKLEDKITNQLGAIDLARPQDKEYFLNKATDTLNSMGDISKLDYSKNGVTRQIDGRINSIVDERVLNDVVSTRNYRSFQSTLQEKQKKGDGTYSATNAAFAMEVGGVNKWLNGKDSKGNAVDGLGTVAYQDYVDVNKELKDISENLDKYAHVVKKFGMEGMYFITQEGKELSASEVKSMASQLLTDKAKGQMRINGWAAYDGGEGSSSPEQVAGRFQQFADAQYKEIDSDIADYQMKAAALKDSNPELAKEYTDAAELVKTHKSRLTSDYNSWIKDPNKARHNMSTTMEMENTLNAFGKAFAINNVGDPVYSSNPVAAAEIDTKIKLAMLDLKTREMDMKYGAGAVTAINTPYSLEDTTTASQVPAEIKADTEKYDGLVTQSYNNLTAEQKSVIDAKASQSDEGTLADRRLAAMDALEYRSVSDQEMLSQARAVKRELDTKQEIYGGALETGFSEVEASIIDEVVVEYYDNRAIKMVNPKTGKKESVADILKASGIASGDGKKLLEPENKALYTELKKSYYGDKIVSSGSGNKMIKTLGAALLANPAGPLPGLTASIGASLVGSDASKSREITMFTDRLTSLFMEGGVDKKTAEKQVLTYLSKIESKGAYDNNKVQDAMSNMIPFVGDYFINRDNSVKDDSLLNNWITIDKVDANTGKKLNESVGDFSSRQRAFLVTADSEVGKDLAARVQSEYISLNPNAVMKFSVSPGMSMSVKAIGGGMAEVSGINVVKNEAIVKRVTVSIDNLPPGILQKVDFEKTNIAYSEKNMKPMSRSFVFSPIGDINQIKFIERKKGLSTEAAAALTRDQTLFDLQNTYKTQLGTTAKPTEIGAAIEKMLNSTNLVASIIEVDKKFYKQIGVKEGRDIIPIHRDLYAIDPSNYETAVENMEIIPTSYVRDLLAKALKVYKEKPDTVPSILKKISQHYGVRK